MSDIIVDNKNASKAEDEVDSCEYDHKVTNGETNIAGVQNAQVVKDILDSTYEAKHLELTRQPREEVFKHVLLADGKSILSKKPDYQETGLSKYLFLGWNLRLILAICVLLSSCCCNVVFLEILVRQDSGIGNLVTFSQFLVIAVEGLIFTSKFGTVRPKIPFRAWVILVVMYFLVSVTNNYALSYKAITMPLHMIFRAGNLIANMVMGMVLLGKRYTTTKYVSIIMITVGIATCTVISATSRVSLKSGKAVFAEEGDLLSPEATDELRRAMETEEKSKLKEMAEGIGLLTIALLISARMGIYQEVLYGRWGRHVKEALFFTHALPLPGFLLLAPDIIKHWQVCLNSAPMDLPLLPPLPCMLVQLLCNIVLQYLCISAVFVLTAETSSLTATLVLTVRKFISLLFSIWYFQNPFNSVHWVGTGLVFCGIILFSDIPELLKRRNLEEDTKVKTE